VVGTGGYVPHGPLVNLSLGSSADDPKAYADCESEATRVRREEG
jgi:hypothetical protein